SERRNLNLPQRFDARYFVNMSIVQPEQRHNERPSKYLHLHKHPVIQDFRNILQVWQQCSLSLWPCALTIAVVLRCANSYFLIIGERWGWKRSRSCDKTERTCRLLQTSKR